MIKIEQNGRKFKIYLDGLPGSRSQVIDVSNVTEMHQVVDHYFSTKEHNRIICPVCAELERFRKSGND